MRNRSQPTFWKSDQKYGFWKFLLIKSSSYKKIYLTRNMRLVKTRIHKKFWRENSNFEVSSGFSNFYLIKIFTNFFDFFFKIFLGVQRRSPPSFRSILQKLEKRSIRTLSDFEMNSSFDVYNLFLCSCHLTKKISHFWIGNFYCKK